MTVSFRRQVRRGFSLIELMIVIAILSIIYFRVAPMISEIKARSALRAARQELTAVFSPPRHAHADRDISQCDGHQQYDGQ
jgi:prepilin-type N-terminal cleavage/methylation domain-containing protein